MTETYRLAKLLVACWRVSGDSPKIPTSHGVLDRAMKRVVEDGALPQWARGALHFADSRIGLQCVELPSILEWAQRSQLASAPNPSYEFMEVQISPRLAERYLNELGVPKDDAIAWGASLRAAAEGAEQELRQFHLARIEEY